ncbi:MAG: TRAP transporter small permease [Burkholderiales bacterium]|nr:TRAP transporter small permease [Burkholderiales bacterium]
MRALLSINNFAAAAVKVLVVVMVVVMLGALSAQVFLRYAFNVTLSWSEELSLGLFTWTVLLMAALGVKEGFHVRMSLLIQRLPSGARLRAEQAIHFATAATGGFLAWSGWRYFADTRGSTSAAIGYPIELLHASALVCGVLIALFALESLLEGRIPADEARSEERV